MAVNEKLVRETIKLIEENGQHWNQTRFVNVTPRGSICDTTLCFAGFACVAALGADKFFDDGLEWDHWSGEWFFVNPVEDRATELLGLETGQAYNIFYCMTDSLDELKAVITESTGIHFDTEEAS